MGDFLKVKYFLTGLRPYIYYNIGVQHCLDWQHKDHAKTKSKICNIWSIKCWKVYTFYRPNSICISSNSPKGAMIAVFATFSGATGIQLKACTKSKV